MKKIKNAYLFTNGNIAVFDEQGQQIPELQTLLNLWCDHCVKLGYNPEGVILETELGKMRIVKQGSSWNRVGVA